MTDDYYLRMRFGQLIENVFDCLGFGPDGQRGDENLCLFELDDPEEIRKALVQAMTDRWPPRVDTDD